MGIFKGLDISTSGLTAQRARLDIISSNLANMHTTRTSEGGPYKRKDIVFEENGGGAQGLSFDKVLDSLKGVSISEIKEDKTAPNKVYDPGHPDADVEGYVAYPNVSQVGEMINMLSATRSYEANVTVVEAYKSMFLKALDIGR